MIHYHYYQTHYHYLLLALEIGTSQSFELAGYFGSFILGKNSLVLNEIFVENLKQIISQLKEPSTILYKSPKNICNLLISDDNRVGFRIVENEFCKLLLKLMNRPLVSTSANLHKETFPKSFKEINEEILKQVDYVVDLPTENWNNKPSSIFKINLDGNLFKIR